MRIGENPAKNIKSVAKPQRITIAVLSYIPFIGGYYSEALDVLKLCLESIWQNTDLSYDLLVFDNGSCDQVKEFLTKAQSTGKIQYLILSEKNVGKGGAWNLIFEGAPGEVIAYCDSDAYLYEGWLSACMKILETFPKVGMVTGRPLRTREELFSATLDWAQSNRDVSLEEGMFISYSEYKEFTETLGYPEDKIKNLYETSHDFLIHYKGMKVFAGANHFQFVGWKNTLKKFVPFIMDKPLGQVLQLDQKMNEDGFLRLMTEKPFVQNMSNRVPSKFLVQRSFTKRKKLKNLAMVKKPLLWFYNKIFQLYFEK
jgi:glycosyltransferase involved in cell wall biosynthesis